MTSRGKHCNFHICESHSQSDYSTTARNPRVTGAATMKQRFSSLDVHIIAHELSAALTSLRLSNLYDLSSRIFLLKFAKPNHREQLLIDSGFRCHLTSFSRATAAAPSPFVARLRKFLRTRRCTKVAQVGTDRVIEIQFSDGAYRLFLEFYAGGNVVLTDADLTIIALLRSVSEGAEHEQYRLGLKYDLSSRQNYAGVPPLTNERVREGLQKAIDRQAEEAQKPGKKIKKKSGDALRKALAVTTTEFPPILLDHALYVTGYDRETAPEQVVASDEALERLLESLRECRRVVEEITSKDIATGYILAKPGKAAGEDGEAAVMYEDFHPFKPAQLAADEAIKTLEFEGFNKTVDEFYSSLEGQKLESRLQEREDNARRKIEASKQENAKRIEGLQSVQELNIRKAQAIEANVERVEEAVAAVNGLIGQGMDWVDIGRLIENEQHRHNAVAETIKLPLKLEENTVTLLLSEYDDPAADDDDLADITDSEASDSDDDTRPSTKPKPEDKRLAIDVDLSLSPWANARKYYDQRRTAASKQEKTALASEKALKSTEQKVLADLKKNLKQEKEVLRPVRRQLWFEKFFYFLSSDHYLILGGRDAQQNEILYRRHLRKGDVYIHADLPGATSIVVKNLKGHEDRPIPPRTLNEAGMFCVCTSEAWDKKSVMGAWWVDAGQVSKTLPSGEFLGSVGEFVVKGKKNFLPPAQLLLGFAVTFRISEQSEARHGNSRSRIDGGPDAQTATVDGGDDGLRMQYDDDDDDEFPDAGHGDDDDDDDDEFPDVKHETAENTAEEDDDGERILSPRDNPLQTNGGGPQDAEEGDSTSSDGDGDDAGEEATGEAEVAESASTPPSTVPDASNHMSDTEGSSRKGKQNKAKSNAKFQQALKQQIKAQNVRGKKGKAKKAAQKYADQDEEDRELAMKLLGSKKAGTDETAAPGEQRESIEEAHARRRAQHERAQKEGLAAEQERLKRMKLQDQGDAAEVDEPDEEESGDLLADIDTLVGTPLAGDEILDLLPLCAPWSALTKYKYKVKLQPGQQKKGKAIREILAKWNRDCADTKKVDQRAEDSDRIWPREAELIKGLKETEVVGLLPVKGVRVMMAGGSGGAEGKKGGKNGGGGRGGRVSKKR